MSPRASLFLVLACAALSPIPAAAQQLRYSATLPGGVVGTGNTLGLSKATNAGDSYAPILAAFAIDVNASDFSDGAATTVDAPSEVSLGETFTVTAALENVGDVTAQDIKFTLPVDAGLSLTDFSTDGKPGDVNGNAVDAGALSGGVDLGALVAGATRMVTLDFKVVEAPMLTGYYLKAKWAYGFEVCPNEPLVPESFSKSALVNFNSSGSSAAHAAAAALGLLGFAALRLRGRRGGRN